MLLSEYTRRVLAATLWVALPPLLVFFIGLFLKQSSATPQPVSVLTPDITHKIDVLVDHIDFVSGWSLAAMGALSAFGLKLIQMGRWHTRFLKYLLAGFGLLAASLYSGHEGRLAILNAYLGADIIDYKSQFVEFMTWIQTLGLLAGSMVFPVIFILLRADSPQPQKPQTTS